MGESPAEDATHPEISEPKHGGLGLLAFSIFLAPVLYVLSLGPAVRFAKSNQLVETLYIPLEYCADRCPPLDALCNWYITDVWHCTYY